MFKALKASLTKAMARRKILQYDKKYAKARPLTERPPTLPVEEMFDAFVTQFGGRKISDMIVSKSLMPLNADYFFEKQNVVAELKTLEGIYSGEVAYEQLTQAFIDSGCTGSDVMGILFRGQPVPEAAAALMCKRLRRSIEQRIKKARQQLKKSKETFGNIDTRCLILIAMDQEPLFGHQTMLLNLAKIMSDNYADEYTDGVIYFNPNMPTKVRPNGMEMSGWYPCYRDENVTAELSNFVNLLGNRWLTFFGSRIGEPNPILELKSPEEMLAALERH